MKVFFCVVIIATIVNSGVGKVFERCELAKQLSGTFPRGDLADWNCLVVHESSYNSAARGPMNRDGTYDYGIFQINSGYWCRLGSPGGDCNIDCNSEWLLSTLTMFSFFDFPRTSRRWHHRWHCLRSPYIPTTWFHGVVRLAEPLQRSTPSECQWLLLRLKDYSILSNDYLQDRQKLTWGETRCANERNTSEE